MSNGIKSLKECLYGRKLRLSVVAIILGIMVLAPIVAAAKNPNDGIVPVGPEYLGKTYGEWSAEWWEWVFSIPEPLNPLKDDKTGTNTIKAQSGDVWFLAGSWNGNTEMNLDIPAGKSIFFPIINGECSTIEGNGETEKELKACAKAQMKCVTVKEATIDGRELVGLDRYRVRSDLFEFTLPKNHILTWVTPPYLPYKSEAVSDGYWIMLKPLSEGKHEIHVHGEAKMPDGSTFITDMTYKLNVVPNVK